jgi:hypothetical protein
MPTVENLKTYLEIFIASNPPWFMTDERVERDLSRGEILSAAQ